MEYLLISFQQKRVAFTGKILFLCIIIGIIPSIVGAYIQYRNSLQIKQAVVVWQVQIDANKVFNPQELSKIRSNEVESLQPLPEELNNIAITKLSDLLYNAQLFLFPRSELPTFYKDIRPKIESTVENLSSGPAAWLSFVHHTEFDYPQKIRNGILITLPPFVQKSISKIETYPKIFFRVTSKGNIRLFTKSRQEIVPWLSISEFSNVKQVKQGGFIIVKQTPEDMDWQFRSIQLYVENKTFELWHPNIVEFGIMEYKGQQGSTLHKQFIGLINGEKTEKPILTDKEVKLFEIKESQTLLDVALQYAKKGDYDAAISCYDHALRTNPNKEELYYLKGVCLANKGETDLAIYNYEHALKLKPSYSDPYVGIGNIHLQNKSYSDAISFYNKAIEYKENHLFAYIHRGLAYSCMGKFKEGLSDLNTAEKINPDVSLVYENRASVYSCMGEDEKSLKDLQQSKKCRIQLKGASPITLLGF